MAKSWDLSDWYAAGALSIPSELLERRTKTLAELLNGKLGPALREGAEAFARVDRVADERVSVLVNALKTADTTYSRVNGEQDLRVFSAALIDAAPVANSDAIAARLAVSSAAFADRRSFGRLDELTRSSRAKLDAGASLRRTTPTPRAPFELPVFDPATLTVTEQNPKGLQTTIEALRNSLTELASAVSHVENVAAVRERVTAEKMELLLLLQTGELKNGTGLASLPPAQAAIAIGFDLALALDAPVMNGTVNRVGNALLRKAGFDPDSRATWSQVHAEGRDLQSLIPVGCSIPLPLSTLLRTNGANWRHQVNEVCAIDLVEAGETSLSQLMVQALLEGQTHRLWAGS